LLRFLPLNLLFIYFLIPNMSYLRTLLVAVTIAAILFSFFSIPPVLAAGATKIIRNNGVRASAFIPGPVGQFSDIFLTVAKSSSAETDIILGYSTPNILGENSFLTTTANVFQTNGLNSATLSPVTLNACVATDESGNCIFVPVTIQATWTGFGVPVAGHGGNVPTCNFVHPLNAHEASIFCGAVFQSGGTDRQATVAGTLNGQSFGQASGDIGTFDILIISLPPSTVNVHP